MSKKLEIERQKAAQLMAFAFGMVERGDFKKIPENATSDERYAVRNENVAKAMEELIRNAKEYGLTFTGDIDTWTKEDTLTRQGLPTMAKTQGRRLGHTLAQGMVNGARYGDIGEHIVSALKEEYKRNR